MPTARSAKIVSEMEGVSRRPLMRIVCKISNGGYFFMTRILHCLSLEGWFLIYFSFFYRFRIAVLKLVDTGRHLDVTWTSPKRCPIWRLTPTGSETENFFGKVSYALRFLAQTLSCRNLYIAPMEECQKHTPQQTLLWFFRLFGRFFWRLSYNDIGHQCVGTWFFWLGII